MTAYALHVDAYVEERSTPEHDLWRAVWNFALNDAIRLHYSAAYWLLTESRDVEIVAELAGVDLPYYRPRLHALLVMLARVITQDWYPRVKTQSVTWRRPTGQERMRAVQFLDSPLGRLPARRLDDLAWSDLRWILAEAYDVTEARP